MATVISKRLDNFINNHLDYEDVGDPENGPKLDSWYEGPNWAIDLIQRIDDPGYFIAEQNMDYYFDEWYFGLGAEK